MDYKDILAMASAYKEVAEASAKTRALQSIKAQPKDKVSLAKAPWEKEKEVKKEALDPVDQKALKGKHKDRKDKDIDNDGDTDSSDEYLHKRRKAVSASIKGQKKGTEVETEVQEMTKAQKRALQGIKAQPKDKVSLKKAPWDKKETKESVEEFVESIAKHMSPWDAKEFLKKHKAHNADFHTLPSSAASAMHDKAKEVKYKKSKSAPGSTGRMFHAALQKHADKLKESVEEIDEATATVKQQKALKALMTKALGGKRAKAGYTSYVGNNGDFVVYDGGGRIVGRLKAGEFQDPLKEEIEELDENKAIIKLYQDMKAQGKKDHNILDYIVSMPKYKRVSRDQMAKMIGDAKRKGIFKEEVELDIEEAKDHGNMNNGSPRGEGLSPSAKKELDRTTPMNPATDELAVNNLNFKTFKAMAKKAPKRSADNDAGDKTMPKNDGK